MTDAETVVMPRIGASEASVEDPWGEGRIARYGTVDRDSAGPAAVVARIASWLVPGAVMGLLGLAGVAGPGLWAAELVTWDRATSSWRENWLPSHGTDVGSVPYHLVMRAWVEGLGTSDLALRAPSLLAMAAAAALVGALATRLFGARVGLLAGVIFALLPTSTRYAQEARPYAFTLLVAVLASLFLVLAIDRPRRWLLVAYGTSVLLLGLFDTVALVLLAGHGWAVLAFGRQLARRWLLASSAGALPVLALLWLGSRVTGLPLRASGGDPGLLAGAPGELFGVTALGALLLGLALFSLPLRRTTAIYTAWAVVPLLVLLLVSRVVSLSLPQCLLFTLPAWATLGAVALGRTRMVWGAAVLAAIAVIGMPVQAALREPDGHDQNTRQLAAIVESGMRSGDGVVYVSTDPDGGRVGRGALDRYLPADRRPDDLLAIGPVSAFGDVPVAECVEVGRCLGDAGRLWVVRLGELTDPMHAIGGRKEELLRTRYEVAQIWRPTGFTLALLVDERTAV
ncbi:mannosyltransferase [Micromonospora pisi]|uniref:Mannosyltransferase n=1 Tax=Micromonospora pisi TaxID=589240 RepID=A0A495JD74_9ACTN|nr:glycosyltransferase family 39 protein [Micromonospora pisi]RKR86302.1 mannosyltransferase [Micromonospora pisi]